MFKGVHSVMFHVSDVRAASDWYAELLGAAPIYLAENFPVFRIGDSEICFHQADAKVGTAKAGVVTYWRVDDFAAAVARAKALGAAIHRGPLDIESGCRICQIADPFGNLFGLAGEVRSGF